MTKKYFHPEYRGCISLKDECDPESCERDNNPSPCPCLKPVPEDQIEKAMKLAGITWKEIEQVTETQEPYWDGEKYAAEKDATKLHIEKWDNRFFAVFEGDELVCVTVYKKGAAEVIRRLSGQRRKNGSQKNLR